MTYTHTHMRAPTPIHTHICMMPHSILWIEVLINYCHKNNDSRGNQDSLRAKVCSSKTEFEQEQERLAIFVVEGNINIPALNGIFLSEKCTFGIKEHIKSYISVLRVYS